MAIRKIRKAWWVDIRYERVRYRKRSPDNSRTGAQAYEAYLRRRLTEGVSVEQTIRNQKQRQTFEDFAHHWFETYVKVHNKPSEIKSKQYALKRIVPFFGKSLVGKISALQIDEFKAALAREGLTKKSINNKLAVLRKCLNTAQEWLELDRVPKVRFLKTPPPSFDFLEPDESKLLLSVLEGRWREITLTALNTGLRLGELRGLRWSDINLKNQTLVVRFSLCAVTSTLISPKGNRERRIPLVTSLSHLFEEKSERASGYVFADRWGRPFDKHCYTNALSKACRQAGLRKVSAQTLRHTFASQLAAAGAPLGAIQQLLGHAHITTTMRYAHLSPTTINNAMALLEAKS